MNIVKNVSDFVSIVKNMPNETDHNAVAKAFKKSKDFQTLKKFLLRGNYFIFFIIRILLFELFMGHS